jgi:hypothetical protein
MAQTFVIPPVVIEQAVEMPIADQIETLSSHIIAELQSMHTENDSDE